MNRQRIGLILIWLGIISAVVTQLITWFQSPMQRIHTAEELRSTVYAVEGALWWIRSMGWVWGLMFPLVGVLLYTSEKGSWFWLLGILPNAAAGLSYLWKPSRYMPGLFGTGGVLILLSYFGILWTWTKTYGKYAGSARTGKQIQLLGYSFLVVTGLLLCLYVGNPNVIAVANFPIPGAESINMTLSLGMVLLFGGHYLAARGSAEMTTG